MKPNHKYKSTNHLIKESSPYLLMHAHNPVDWYPWGEKALKKAKRENKLLIISIGYAACHWCHVMEHESFSNEDVAEIMNKYYISVKVDREERPDIDQVYMDAAQFLTGQGGWPLNIIALPDGKPIFAGTYFNKYQWLHLLQQMVQINEDTPQKLAQQAEAITKGIQTLSIIDVNPAKPEFDPESLNIMIDGWLKSIDFKWGGEKRAPKFPMPNNYKFLLSYSQLPKIDQKNKTKSLQAVEITLEQMALGGIYDQIGGGFARYSTDKYWRVPHFEKMLYDNAQLVSLYSYAYQLTQRPLFKKVVYDTLEFIERELTSPILPKGGRGFYSSLDADSEGEEGKFYVWHNSEIKNLLGENAPMVIEYYNVTEKGNWEKGNNILFRLETDKIFAQKRQMKIPELQTLINSSKKIMLSTRSKRISPALDDKFLTSWNALMISGYIDAYRVFDEKKYLERAMDNANFILKQMLSENGQLNRNYKNGKSSINAFLDDYAFTIQAFIALYQATFQEKWLFTADKILKYTLHHFYDKKTQMFFYTSDQDPELITRKIEFTDNVIPSSNSQMAINLYLLGENFFKNEYLQKSKQMLNNVMEKLKQNGPFFSNWGMLLSCLLSPSTEVAIVGNNWEELRKQLDQYFLPNTILMGGSEEGQLPLLKDKLIAGQTTIFVCKDNACRRPVTTVKEALEQLL